VTPREQIAYLRSFTHRDPPRWDAIDAVCDLAERALLTDERHQADPTATMDDLFASAKAWEAEAMRYRLTEDEAEAVQWWLSFQWDEWPKVRAVLRRLLP
jgi:hypothetical protein